MKKYVVGFAFNGDFVLLIKKEKPQWQKGLYNGLGGHIEENEQPVAAMVREFKEECGIDTDETQWDEFAVMKGDDWVCHCFRSRNIFDLCKAKQTTDEEPKSINVYTLELYPTISNIPALIGLARDNFNPKSALFDYSTQIITQ
jgi:8-oxo-dGTP diphosphatase